MPKMMSQRQFKQAVQRIMFRKPTVRRCLQCEIEGGSPGRPIQAHSVQANGPLKAICGRHNTVATFYGFFLPRNQGQPSDRGIRMASTFLGLCSTHDNALFHTIDTEPFCGNHQQMLAVMFRGLCWELYLKYDVVQRFEEILGLCERERRFQEREGFLASLEGQKKGISESKGILHDLYHMRTGEQSLDLHGWWGEFSGPSVLAGAGAVNPIFGEDGQALQNPRADSGMGSPLCDGTERQNPRYLRVAFLRSRHGNICQAMGVHRRNARATRMAELVLPQLRKHALQS